MDSVRGKIVEATEFGVIFYIPDSVDLYFLPSYHFIYLNLKIQCWKVRIVCDSHLFLSSLTLAFDFNKSDCQNEKHWNPCCLLGQVHFPPYHNILEAPLLHLPQKVPPTPHTPALTSQPSCDWCFAIFYSRVPTYDIIHFKRFIMVGKYLETKSCFSFHN